MASLGDGDGGRRATAPGSATGTACWVAATEEPRRRSRRADRQALAAAMADLAGDAAVAVPFVLAYGDRLADVVRRHLRDLGRADLARDPDEVQGLVWDVADVLHANAAAWDPAGALPWTWAWRPIRSRLAAAIGHARAEVEPDALPLQEAPPMAAAGSEDLRALAAAHDRLALVLEALTAIPATERQREIHLEYRIQKACGDPSPASTVAWQFGVSEANVRQIDRRIRVRLSRLVASDGRYRPLRVILWLDAGIVGEGAEPRSAPGELCDA